jgi:Holliday junction DNA helicase RuvB
MARKKHTEHTDPPPGTTGAAELVDALGAMEPSAAARADRSDEVMPIEKHGERAWQTALRPRTFEDYIGQRELIDNLRVSVRAAKQNGWSLDHFLFAGPPGLGKTTLAHVIANELGVNLHVTSGPAIDHKGMLASLLTSLGEGDALFIDEIHRLSPIVEENLYPAMEDFKFDLFIGDGPHAKAVTMKLPRFTLLGATTRMGLLSAPLLDRFGFHWQLRYYELADMISIVRRSAALIGVPIDADGADEIARRARGTPRIANRLLRRVRDFAAVEGDGTVTGAIAASALDRLAVDHAGLDALDRAFLSVICERFDGGPVGIEAVAASLSEERGTLEEVVEPFLLQIGFVTRTPRGRMATGSGFAHLGLTAPSKAPTGGSNPGGSQGRLF